eukprot:TRINITY_DN3132_c0_g1_i1.p3 TRINITY_DN3132_c0_g1~~TRINITY_DN3132_c0_g1_i1.p3  ORF type:complete len:105 (-),score=23.02 TRINITY_DN3132_c0_g1_i1:91-405(-)
MPASASGGASTGAVAAVAAAAAAAAAATAAAASCRPPSTVCGAADESEVDHERLPPSKWHPHARRPCQITVENPRGSDAEREPRCLHSCALVEVLLRALHLTRT